MLITLKVDDHGSLLLRWWRRVVSRRGWWGSVGGHHHGLSRLHHRLHHGLLHVHVLRNTIIIFKNNSRFYCRKLFYT